MWGVWGGVVKRGPEGIRGEGFEVSVFLWDGVLNSERENMKRGECREGEAGEVEERWVK